MTGAKWADGLRGGWSFRNTLGNSVWILPLRNTLERFRPKFRLSTDQTYAITSVVRDMLMANVYLGDIVGAIQAAVHVDPQRAKAMADTFVYGTLARCNVRHKRDTSNEVSAKREESYG